MLFVGVLFTFHSDKENVWGYFSQIKNTFSDWFWTKAIPVVLDDSLTL